MLGRFQFPLAAAMMLGAVGNAHAQTYQVVSVPSAGNIRGSVKWSGPEPRLATFVINKDPQVCDPDSQKTRDLERLIIGPDAGVKNTVVYLKNVSKGKPFDFPQARRFLDQKHCRYEPHILLVPENTALEMKSSDATLHTIHMSGAATYNLPFPFPDQVVSRDMRTAGLVNLRCNGGHMWMNAEMFVAPHPYYTVTDENGHFELTQVPPGQYEIVAWHEGWSVVRHEEALDVLTQNHMMRPVFGDPKVLEKTVTVNAGETTLVNFTISSK